MQYCTYDSRARYSRLVLRYILIYSTIHFCIESLFMKGGGKDPIWYFSHAHFYVKPTLNYRQYPLYYYIVHYIPETGEISIEKKASYFRKKKTQKIPTKYLVVYTMTTSIVVLRQSSKKGSWNIAYQQPRPFLRVLYSAMDAANCCIVN